MLQYTYLLASDTNDDKEFGHEGLLFVEFPFFTLFCLQKNGRSRLQPIGKSSWIDMLKLRGWKRVSLESCMYPP